MRVGQDAAVDRRDVDLASIAWAVLLGVVMFFAGALLNRYVWGDGFDWWKAAFVAVPTTLFAAVTGVLQRPRSRRSDDDVR